MAKKQHVYEMIIKGNVENLEASMKQAVSMMKTKMAEMDKAADKVTHLKELVDYISQIDRALDALATKNPDMFKRVFAGMDSGLKNVMEQVFGSSSSQLTALDALRDRLKNLTPDSTVRDIKAVATEVNELFKLLGQKAPLTLGAMTGTTKEKDIQAMTGALADFAMTWENVNKKLAGGFGFSSSSGESGGDLFGRDTEGQLFNELQNKIDQLETKKREIQEVVDALGGTPIVVETNKKNEIQVLQGLLDEYREIEAKIATSSAKERRDLSLKQIVLAAKIAGTSSYLEENSENIKTVSFLNNPNIQGMSERWQTLRNDKTQVGWSDELKAYSQQLVNIRDEMASLEAQKLTSYDSINGKIQEYIRLQKEMQALDRKSPAYAQLKNQANDIVSQFLAVKPEMDEDSFYYVFDQLTDDGENTTAVVTELCRLFGIQLPSEIDKTKNSIDGLVTETNTNNKTKAEVDEIGKSADEAEIRVNALQQSLKEVLTTASQMQVDVSQGKMSGQEAMSLIGNDGLISSAQGVDYSVDTDTLVNQLLANLKQNIVMSLHNHPDGMGFSPSDLKSFADLYYSQGVKLHGIATDGLIKTIDFSGISQELAQKIAQSYAQNLNKVIKGANGILEFDDTNGFKLTEKMKQLNVSDPDKYSNIMGAVNDAIDSALHQAFKDNGVVSTFNAYSTEALPELAIQLDKIQQSGPNALSPIEKLKNLLTTLHPDKTFNWDNYTEILKQLETGSIDGTNAMNQILDLNSVSAQVDQAKAITDEKQKQNALDSQATAQSVDAAKQELALEQAITQENKEQATLSDTASATTDTVPEGELTDAKALLETIKAIEVAVDDKTAAFENEARTVDQVVTKEIRSLSELKSYIEGLKRDVNALFDVDIKQSAIDALRPVNTEDSVSDNDATQNASASTTEQKDGGTTDGYALNSTLLETNGILTNILHALQNDSGVSQELASSLQATATELHNAANGIIEEQKAKKVDTRKANARIVDPTTSDEIQQIALNAVSDRVTDGGNYAVTNMQAMANGMVKVSGYIQTASDAWEGFTLQVNEANEVSKIAFDTNSKAAKEAARLAKQESQKTPKESKKVYDEDQVRANAQEHIDRYTAEGKQATVKLADDGKYTITVLEEIDGLAKKVTQTLDETGVKEERVAASISNAQKIKLKNLQALIKAGSAEGHVNDSDDVYKQYQKATQELDDLNTKYQNNSNLSDEEILKWNEQIKLVQQLGTSVENLINKRKVATTDSAAPDDVFKSKRQKQVGKFNLDEAKLRAEINIPESYNQQIEEARKKMADAVDEQALQIAVNEWDALKNAIKKTATEQDLFVKKSKTVKETGAEKAAKEIAKNKLLQPAQSIMGTATEEMKSALGTNFNRKDLTDEQKEIKQLYDNLGEAVEAYNTKVKYGQQAELSGIQQIEQALYDKINAYKTNNHIVDARKSTFGATTTNRIVGTHTELKNKVESQFADSSVATQKLKEYTAAIKHLKEIQSQFGVGERDITADQEQEFNVARDACNKYAQELTKLISASEKAAAASVKSASLGADFADNEAGRMVALKQFVQDTYGATAVIGDFANANNKLFFTINNGDGTFSEMAAEINGLRNAINVTSKSTKQATNTFDAFVKTMEDKFKSIGAYLISSFSIQEVWQQLRKGVEYVREIDLALTELKKVTDETDASYERFLGHMSETASVVGSTVKDLTTMAAEWGRLGYSMAEAGKLAESTAVLLNVSEFQDATTASEALISTMQAFQYTADESGHVVDILNEVGNNFAVSSDGLATALQDSASALVEGGNNLEQAVALVAAANRVVQDPNSVGEQLCRH